MFSPTKPTARLGHPLSVYNKEESERAGGIRERVAAPRHRRDEKLEPATCRRDSPSPSSLSPLLLVPLRWDKWTSERSLRVCRDMTLKSNAPAKRRSFGARAFFAPTYRFLTYTLRPKNSRDRFRRVCAAENFSDRRVCCSPFLRRCVCERKSSVQVRANWIMFF